jgi:hypothetical protein
MASKTFTKGGMILSAILFVAAVVCMIIVIVQSAPTNGLMWITTYTDVETRSSFSEESATNMTSLILSPDTIGKWGTIPGDFESFYRVTVDI